MNIAIRKDMDRLVSDTKQIKRKIEELEIDWARFRKIVKKVQNDIGRSRSEAGTAICS